MNVQALHRQSHRDRGSAQPARKVLGLQGRSRSLEPVPKSLEDYGSLVAMYVNRQFTNDGGALLTFEGIQQTDNRPLFQVTPKDVLQHYASLEARGGMSTATTQRISQLVVGGVERPPSPSQML
jgi:hypothetical protein